MITDKQIETHQRNARIREIAQQILPAMIASYTRDTPSGKENFWGVVVTALTTAESFVKEADSRFPLL